MNAWCPPDWVSDCRRNVTRLYHAGLSFTDKNIGELLAELRALRVAHNTLVVFHSDHGHLLGENGNLWGQNVISGTRAVVS